MTNSNKQVNRIYYRPLKKCLEVSKEEKHNWDRTVNTIRKHKQYHGLCCIPYDIVYLCDGLCDNCRYRRMSEIEKKSQSIDFELENIEENGMARDSILADKNMTFSVDFDHQILYDLLKEVKETDPDNYKILLCIANGLSERKSADVLKISRKAFVLRRNKLLNSLKNKYF